MKTTDTIYRVTSPPSIISNKEFSGWNNIHNIACRYTTMNLEFKVRNYNKSRFIHLFIGLQIASFHHSLRNLLQFLQVSSNILSAVVK